MRPFYKNSDGLITRRGHSCCGDDGHQDWEMFTEQEQDLSCYNKDLFPHQIYALATRSVTSRNLQRPRETAVGQRCHLRFHRREGNPGSERLSDSSKVTSKSVGRVWGPPCSWKPCPSVLYIFKGSEGPPSRSSTLLPLSVGSTLRNRQWKGKSSNFTVKKPHKYHLN